MNWLWVIAFRLRGVFAKRRRDAELDEELQAHLEMLAEENVERGMPPEAARRAARVALGGAEHIKEAVRDQRGLPLLESLVQDVRFALRMFRKNPAFTAVAVLTLALGIGSMTAIFGVMYGLLIAPFPYPSLNRIVTLSMQNTSPSGGSSRRDWFSGPEFLALRGENHTFDDLIAYSTHTVLYNDGTSALPFSDTRVTADTFDFYGAKPLLGRALTKDDEKTGTAPVFVMTYALWHADFGSDPKLLGASFNLDGTPSTLVGIMPPRFELYGASILSPLDATFSNAGTAGLVGRLKKGVSRETAASDLEAIEQRLPQGQSVFSYQHFAIRVDSLTDSVLGNFKRALLALIAAVSLLLLIACTNVANLLLSRATIREREIAIRASMGASRARLVRQLLTESFLLSSAACAAGCTLAYFGLKAIVTIVPAGRIPQDAAIGLNPTILGMAIAISVVSSLLCGLAPALRVASGDPQPQLTSSGTQASAGFKHGKLRSGLTVAQVAFSVVLLIAAGLMLRTFFGLTHADLPFDASKTLYLRLNPPRAEYYAKPDRKPAFFRAVLPRIQSLPGVTSVTEALMIPPNEGSWTDVAIPGKPHAGRWVTDIEMCTQGYFATLGLRLVQGRLLSEDDINSARYVAVVNQTLVRDYFGNENPIGQKIKFEVFDRSVVDAPHNTYFEIVGVIADFKTRPEGTQYTLRPEAFMPASVAGFMYPITILAKTSVDPHVLLKSVEQQVWAVDPGVAINEAGSINDFLKGQLGEPRFEFVSLGVFAAIGLALSAIGVFSVMAYAVSLQTRDIGIRMALGAQQSNILRAVLAEGITLVAIGTVIGLCASLAATRFIASQIWGVSPTDPWTFAAVIAVIVAVGLAACWIPAQRATRVDPMVALRHE